MAAQRVAVTGPAFGALRAGPCPCVADGLPRAFVQCIGLASSLARRWGADGKARS
jgi:hypothetical protein